MATDDREKMLKALSPLSRAEAEQRFEEFLGGDLDPEQEALMQETLLLDEETLLAFADRIAEKVQAKEIPLRDWPSDLPMPAMEWFVTQTGVSALSQGAPVGREAAARSAQTPFAAMPDAVRKVLGTILDEVKQLAAQGVEWAKDQLEQMQRCIHGAVSVWQMLPAGGGLGLEERGMPSMRGAQEVTADVLDADWHSQGTSIPFDITQGPLITPGGDFLLTVSTPQGQWQGALVMCTVSLVEGQRVSIPGTVEAEPSGLGGLVHFTAKEFFSPLPQPVEIPLEFIHLSLLTGY